MTKKRKAMRIPNLERFTSDEAKQRFEDTFRTKALFLEKGFVDRDPQSTGLPDYVTEVIEQRQWQRFCHHPEDPYVSLVREFYSNLTSPTQDSVTIREEAVPFSAAAINALFELIEAEDEYTALADNPTQEQLDEMLRTLTIDDTAWIISAQGTRTCPRTALRPSAKVWYHFLRTRLMPTSHDHTISQDRMILLYAILSGKSVNIGRIIHSQICLAATKTQGRQGKLFFPSLITSLCMRANVSYNADEEQVKNTGAISEATIARLIGGENEPAPQQPAGDAAASSSIPTSKAAASGKAPRSFAAASPAASGFGASKLTEIKDRLDQQEKTQKEMMALLKTMHEQQQTYWGYAHVRDGCIKRMLQLGFPDAVVVFPEFPEQIFEEWQPESTAAADPTTAGDQAAAIALTNLGGTRATPPATEAATPSTTRDQTGTV